MRIHKRILQTRPDLIQEYPRVADAIVINVENVNEYLIKFRGQDSFEEIIESFPCLAPPWDNFFMQYKALQPPKFDGYSIEEVVEILDTQYLTDVGVHFIASDVDGDDYKWLVDIYIFLRYNRDRFEVLGPFEVHVDKDGKYIPFGSLDLFLTVVGSDEFNSQIKSEGGGNALQIASGGKIGRDWESVKETPEQMLGYAISCLLAICFIHCPQQVQVIPSKPIGERRKRRARKKGKPLYKTYTLEIEGMRRLLYEKGQIEKLGLKKALHIVRGHFATYSDHAPLFGHYVGTVWKPQHLRGKSQHGEIDKDYEVVMGKKRRNRPRK